jgi:hypothetical protein
LAKADLLDLAKSRNDFTIVLDVGPTLFEWSLNLHIQWYSRDQHYPASTRLAQYRLSRCPFRRHRLAMDLCTLSSYRGVRFGSCRPIPYRLVDLLN